MKRLITLIVGVLCTAPWSVRAQFDDAAAAQLQKLVQAYRYVDAAYVDSLDTAPLVEEAIRGMLTRLDPHSAYLSEEEMKGVDESFDGSFGGIGIEFNVLNDTVVIVNTDRRRPFGAGGTAAGRPDRGDRRAAGRRLSRAEVPKRLRGPSGTQVRLEVSRHAVKEPLAFTVTRGDIPLHTVDAAYKVDAETGYIKVNRFGRTTMQEFVEAFKGMKGVRSLILDLRGNGGGLLDQAVAMANFFLPRGSPDRLDRGARGAAPRLYGAGRRRFSPRAGRGAHRRELGFGQRDRRRGVAGLGPGGGRRSSELRQGVGATSVPVGRRLGDPRHGGALSHPFGAGYSATL